MYFVVEKEQDFEQLKEMGEVYPCFVELVTTNDCYHPKLTRLVAVYVRPVREDETDPRTGEVVDKAEGYIIPVSHDDGLNVSREKVLEILNSFSEVWVLNKKAFLYHFNLKVPVHDLSLKYAMTFYQKLDVAVRETTSEWFYIRYRTLENVNQVIPIVKLYERCEELFVKIEKYLKLENPEGFEFYDNLATKLYFLVEQEGIRVDVHEFKERFRVEVPSFSVDGETVYTNYNLYNATSRPTNAFNSVNFLAIPKGKEFRRCWKPSNDEFVEFDFDGYHVRLISELVGYPISCEEKAHKILAKLRTGKTEFTEEEYAQIKAENFKMIYGSPSDEDAKLELSQKIQAKISELWKEFQTEGRIINKESGKTFCKKYLEDMYPNKLFNYLVQSLETSRNIKVLGKVLKYLARGHFKSKVILITYDSFLIDYAKSDGEEVLNEIRELMETGTVKYPVSLKRSQDLNFK